jgi:hypothetical protein
MHRDHKVGCHTKDSRQINWRRHVSGETPKHFLLRQTLMESHTESRAIVTRIRQTSLTGQVAPVVRGLRLLT